MLLSTMMIRKFVPLLVFNFDVHLLVDDAIAAAYGSVADP